MFILIVKLLQFFITKGAPNFCNNADETDMVEEGVKKVSSVLLVAEFEVADSDFEPLLLCWDVIVVEGFISGLPGILGE